MDSKSIHRQHAQLIAQSLGLKLTSLNITPALRTLGVYKLLPLRFFPTWKMKAKVVSYGKDHFMKSPDKGILNTRLSSSGGPWVARANAYISAKHRVRMIALYLQSEKKSGLVIGAANRTEWMTGTFTQFGCDHCADVMPLLHLYRSQLIHLAEFLHVPSKIIQKKADPDVLPGLDDKGELLGSFESTDLILWGLENGISMEELKQEFDSKQVLYIQKLVESSTHYRESPSSLL
jgi:NAD+ synthase